MSSDREDLKALTLACGEVWRVLRAGDQKAMNALLHPRFQATGYPIVSAPPAEEPEPREAAARAETPADPVAAMHELIAFYGEGSGLTNLLHRVEGAQQLGEFGVAKLFWMAERGLGEGGSPRYLSGRVTLTFERKDGALLLAGWLGAAGPHESRDASQRAADVQAIREQILRVFEAYRQKDQAMLRRTHTAEWRGFALSSGSVGRGIDAYMHAASRAMVSMQFEEYRILELDAIFYGDIAIVPYVALVAGKTAQGRREQSRLRVMDVYLKEPSGWNQIASNVCLHPEEYRGA